MLHADDQRSLSTQLLLDCPVSHQRTSSLAQSDKHAGDCHNFPLTVHSVTVNHPVCHLVGPCLLLLHLLDIILSISNLIFIHKILWSVILALFLELFTDLYWLFLSFLGFLLVVASSYIFSLAPDNFFMDLFADNFSILSYPADNFSIPSYPAIFSTFCFHFYILSWSNAIQVPNSTVWWFNY